MTAKQLAKTLKQQFKGIVSGPVEFRGELTLEVSAASRIAEVCQFAKAEQGFDFVQMLVLKIWSLGWAWAF